MYVSNDDNARKKYNEFVRQFEENRFILNQDIDFIKYYLEALIGNVEHINKGQKFYRARINGAQPFEYDTDLGAPPLGQASPGRVNPKGISYLYVALNKETVIAEVQPWLNAEITIAECTAMEHLKVLDLLPTGQERIRQHSYRRVISEEFSKPIRPETKELEYLPTQYIGEYFKDKRYDGIRYESALHSGGINIAFFDPTKFKIERVEKVRVSKINYDFSRI